MTGSSNRLLVLSNLSAVVLFSVICLGVGFKLGQASGEVRVRTEVQSAAKVCNTIINMGLNDLAVSYIVAGGDPKDIRFWGCKELEDIGNDVYWDSHSKRVRFDNPLGIARRERQ